MLKEDYKEIFKGIGTVRKLKKEWLFWDIMTINDANCKKISGISNMRRIYV